MVSRPVRIPARHLPLSLQSVQICSQVGLKHAPATNSKKFPNLYVEPMQYNNPNGKWSENIPYMVINLEHGKDVYLGKDTVMAYAREKKTNPATTWRLTRSLNWPMSRRIPQQKVRASSNRI